MALFSCMVFAFLLPKHILNLLVLEGKFSFLMNLVSVKDY